MNAMIAPLHAILELNTRLLVNCLDGVDDATAARRVEGRTNNMAFLAAHVLDARVFLAGYLGLEVESPLPEEMQEARGIDDVSELPTLESIRESWTEVWAALEPRLREVREEELLAWSPRSFPVSDPTVRGGVAFLTQHESYHVGQLALLRRAFGHEAMEYT